MHIIPVAGGYDAIERADLSLRTLENDCRGGGRKAGPKTADLDRAGLADVGRTELFPVRPQSEERFQRHCRGRPDAARGADYALRHQCHRSRLFGTDDAQGRI